jgi:hypothetical protein
MPMRLDHLRTLSLCLVCIVGLACTSNEGGSCGGIAGDECGADEYCDYSNNKCGNGDFPGTCKRRPFACPDIFMPTCACNGVVYTSACDAASHGFDVSATAACQD